MSHIRYKQGNLTHATQPLIIHGCNCFHTMGAGVAKALRQAYPEVIEADRKTIRGDKSKLGSFSIAYLMDGRRILNCYTQFRYGRGQRHFNYEAFTLCCRQITATFPQCPIAMPFIGCGLAGGDWDKVLTILHTELPTHQITVYHL